MKKTLSLFIFYLVTMPLYVFGMQQPTQVTVDWFSWREMIVRKPQGALFCANKLKLDFLQEPTEEKYQELVQQCPFFLLDECSQQDCPNNRKKGFRELFEDNIVRALVDKIDKAKDQKVSYIGFGSGFLFSDFVIIIKTLHQRQNASIAISFIDIFYQDKWWNLCGDGEHCSSEKRCALLKAKKEWPIFLNLGVAQFKESIKQMFPDVKIEIQLLHYNHQNVMEVVDCFPNSPDEALDYQKLMTQIVQEPHMIVTLDLHNTNSLELFLGLCFAKFGDIESYVLLGNTIRSYDFSDGKSLQRREYYFAS